MQLLHGHDRDVHCDRKLPWVLAAKKTVSNGAKWAGGVPSDRLIQSTCFLAPLTVVRKPRSNSFCNYMQLRSSKGVIILGPFVQQSQGT